MSYEYKIQPQELLEKYTVRQIFFMFDEMVYFKTGKRKNGDLADKKDMQHSFIEDDRTQQVVDFVEAEKDSYLWDDHKNEWYIPAGQGFKRYQPDYPIAKYRKERVWQ